MNKVKKTMMKRKFIIFNIITALAIIISMVLFYYHSVRNILNDELAQNVIELQRLFRNAIENQHQALSELGMEDLYKEKYQDELLTTLQQRYYKTGNSRLYPAIVDKAGKVILHPTLKRGSEELQKEPFLQKILQQKNGQQLYKLKGEEKWMVYNTFEPWQWIAIYAVNLESQKTRIHGILINVSLLLLIISLCIVVATYLVVKKITAPLIKVTDAIKDIAQGEGDLTIRLVSNSNDESGELANWFNTFLNKLQGIMQMIAGGTGSLTSAAENLSSSSIQMTEYAEKVGKQSNSVAAATEQVSINVNSVSEAAKHMSEEVNNVASSIKDMNSSLKEIVLHCQSELKIALQANERVGSTKEIMEKLNDSAKEIGKVIDVINNVAAQTKLLALNATIEAAAAGDAGKGFAVVANEVKELARQTALATGKISSQIENMQNNTAQAKKAIEEISQTIMEINNISSTITNAVQEQNVTINEISNSVVNASTAASEIAQKVEVSAAGLSEITQNIHGVDLAVAEAAKGITDINQNTFNLAQLSEDLKNVVKQFKV